MGNLTKTTAQLNQILAKMVEAAASIGFGGAVNKTTFDENGNMTMHGNATVFDDVTFDAMNIRVIGTGVSVNTTELSVDFTTAADIDDYLYVNVQLPHARKLASVIFPHVHFSQAQNAIPNFAIQYRWQKNLAAKTTDWTALKMNTLATPYTSGTINNIATTAAGIAAPSGDGISDVIQFKIHRDTKNELGLSFAADPYTATVGVLQFDIHVEKDTLGSNEEYVK